MTSKDINWNWEEELSLLFHKLTPPTEQDVRYIIEQTIGLIKHQMENKYD